MTDTLVYAISVYDKRHLMTVLEWGPDNVKASLKWCEGYSAMFTHIEVIEPERTYIQALKRQLKLEAWDELVFTFPSSPHQKMLHLLHVAAQ